MTLVCIGLATSGLDPDRDELLEVGAYAMTREKLTFADEFKARIRTDVAKLLPSVDEKVADMHDNNGLWLELMAGEGVTAVGADDALAVWLDRVGASGSPRSPLIAFGADWTAGWLMHHLPKSLGRLGGQRGDRIDMGAILRANGRQRGHTNGRAIVVAQSCAQSFRDMFLHTRT